MAASNRRKAVAALAVVALAWLTVGGIVWSRVAKDAVSLAGSGGDGTTYLLIGSDNRAGNAGQVRPEFGSVSDVPGARADVVLLVRKDGDGVRALAIPRDLVIFERGKGPNRLTLTFDDGPGAVADALCFSLGIGVDHVATAEFDGIRSLVGLAGGVDVVADATMRDMNTGLLVKAGPSRLGPDQALAYVRARHLEVPKGDKWVRDDRLSARRPQRAAEVLQSLAKRLPASPFDPIGSARTVWIATKAVSVGSSTGPFDLLGMARAASGLKASDLATLPVVDVPGPVPIADPAPTAGAAVRQFLGRSRSVPRCRTAAILPPR